MRLAWVAAATVALSAAASAQVKDGDVPSYKFSNALVNGQGVRSLADLQGRPVLVEFWGVH